MINVEVHKVLWLHNDHNTVSNFCFQLTIIFKFLVSNSELYKNLLTF